MNEKGFSVILILVGITLVGVIAGGIIFSRQVNTTQPLRDLTSVTNLDQTSSIASDSAGLDDILAENKRSFPADKKTSSSCGKDCKEYIDKKFQVLKQDLLLVLQTQKSESTTNTTPSTSTTTSNTPKEIYVYFGVNGSNISTSWVDIPGSMTSFDVASYPGVRAIYFQGNIRSDAPDKTAYARIYDATNGTDIVGSEMSYTGLTSTLIESNALRLPSGRVNLKVQVKSFIGNMAIIENPRLRIVY